MILVESILGSLHDSAWSDRLGGARIDWLVLDQWDAQKNRFRRRTGGNQEIAVALDRNTHLHDGDVLAWNEDTRTAIVTRIELKEVMVIDLSELTSQNRESLMRSCFELGHALGNQHWPAIMKGQKLFVPLTVDRAVMSSVMRTHAIPGVRYEFIPGAEVIPYLAPHEARRLFGGADATPHSHVQEHAHEH